MKEVSYALNKIVDEINEEIVKFQENLENTKKGNAAAARRARKNSLMLSQLCKEFRATSVEEFKKKEA